MAIDDSKLHTESELERARDFYLTLLQEFPALIWRSNDRGECDWFNTTWLDFTGRTHEQEYGSGWVAGVHEEDLERCVSVWDENFAARTAFVMEYRLRRHDGVYRWIRDFGRPFFSPEGEFMGFIGACYDISDLLDAKEELVHLATHDMLTGIPNRRAFEDELRRAVSFAKRDALSTVIFADVDGFKAANDKGGHEFGDRALVQIAQAIRGVVRETDFVARIGGDEFGIVLWGLGATEAEEIATRLDEAVAELGESLGLKLGLSTGAAMVTNESDISHVIAEADRRMYEAKPRM